ncbi:MAG: VOC family protein [Candidatus Baltobacteraceae bacterium]
MEKPPGWHSVTPRLVVRDPAKLVAFLVHAFGASGEYLADAPSQMRIGDSIVMVSGAGPREPMPAFLYVYVDDADATYRRALGAGAVTVEEPAETPYGDRRAMVTDPWGNAWQIATYRPL